MECGLLQKKRHWFTKSIDSEGSIVENKNIQSTIQLRNGVKMPQIGFGTAEIAPTLKEQVVIIENAIDVGYRLLDTAQIYHTERGVGEAIRNSGVYRDDFFISTKIWNGEARRGKKAILKSFEESLRRLGTDYVDLLLLHWPVPGKIIDTWKVMEDLYYMGKVRALGLSNVERYQHLEIIQNCDIMPHVQQDSNNPLCRNLYNKLFCDNHGIVFEAFSPILRGKISEMDVLREIGAKYGKSAIQVTLRWDIQSGVVSIPRTSNKNHMISNADIFDFELTDEDMQAINSLNQEKDNNWDIKYFNF